MVKKVSATNYFRDISHPIGDDATLWVSYDFTNGSFDFALMDDNSRDYMARTSKFSEISDIVKLVEVNYGVSVPMHILRALNDYSAVSQRVSGVNVVLSTDDCDYCGTNIDCLVAFVIPGGVRHDSALEATLTVGCYHKVVFRGLVDNSLDLDEFRKFIATTLADCDSEDDDELHIDALEAISDFTAFLDDNYKIV